MGVPYWIPKSIPTMEQYQIPNLFKMTGIMAGMRIYEKDRENSRRQTFTGIRSQWKMSLCCCLANLFLFHATM